MATRSSSSNASPTPSDAAAQERLSRDVRLIYLFRFLHEAQIWVPVWLVYLLIERGFSLTQVGAAEAVFLIGLTTLEVPTGAVADRWGRRTSLVLGASTLVAGSLWFRAHGREPEHAGVAPPEHPHSVIAASIPSQPWEPR